MAETYFEYNGVVLEMLKTNEISVKPVRTQDDCHFECNKWTFDVVCLYSPSMTSYRDKDAGYALDPARLSSAKTHFAPYTMRALHQILNQPRKRLVYKVGGVEILRSPRTGYEADVKNGPLPKATIVEAIHGEKTFTVYFQCETYVLGCPGANVTQPVMLSHRWSNYIDTDADYFEIRVTEGEVVFNVSELLRRGTIPDQYRRSFIHGIPLACQRESQQVKQDSDGCTIRYRLVDREKAFSLGPESEATRIEAYLSAWVSETGMMGAAADAFELLPVGGMPFPIPVGPIRDAFGGLGRLNLNPAEGFGIPGAVGGFVGNQIERAIKMAKMALPRYHYTCIAKLWGSRRSNRNRMTGVGVAVCAHRLGAVFSPSATTELQISHQLDGKFVEVIMSKSFGPLAGGPDDGLPAVPGATLASMGLAAYAGTSTLEKLIRPFGQEEDTIFRIGVANPAPPEDRGTRGTLPVTLVSQALTDACDAIPLPPPAAVREDLVV